MALGIRNVSAPFAHALGPAVVVEFIKLAVAAAASDALAVDAWEICLAAGAPTESGAERFVPDVRLPGRGGVNGRDAITRVVRHVNAVFVRADAVESRQFVIRQDVALQLQSPARMRDPYDCALPLRPLQDRQIPCGPILQNLSARIILLFQAQQHKMAAMRGWEA